MIECIVRSKRPAEVGAEGHKLQMTPRDLAKIMADYEMSHGVEDYIAFGWWVWPYLRNSLGRAMIEVSVSGVPESSLQPPQGSFISKVNGRLRGLIKVVGDYSRSVFASQGNTVDKPGSDILMVVTSRRQMVDGVWVQYVAEPVADALQTAGLKSLIWQLGPVPRAVSRSAIDVAPLLRFWTEVRRRSWAKSPIAAPRWFGDYAQFYKECLGTDISWKNLSPILAYIASMSCIMEPWIRRSKVRLVILDCWYNWECMAACLAARRLGVPVMDVQHGIQEFGHYAYHHWQKMPARADSPMPNLYWVWGEKAADLQRESTRDRREVIQGGNIWMHHWLSGSNYTDAVEILPILKLAKPASKTIIVTLSNPSAPQMPFLRAAIERCPADWLWLVRVHPVERSIMHIVKSRFSGLDEKRILIDEASDLPLYALLRMADLHVSADSTVSLEALAFGKATVIISEVGAKVYNELISKGAMLCALQADTFTEIAMKAMQIPIETLRRFAGAFFADHDATVAAIDRICSIANIRARAARPAV